MDSPSSFDGLRLKGPSSLALILTPIFVTLLLPLVPAAPSGEAPWEALGNEDLDKARVKRQTIDVSFPYMVYGTISVLATLTYFLSAAYVAQTSSQQAPAAQSKAGGGPSSRHLQDQSPSHHQGWQDHRYYYPMQSPYANDLAAADSPVALQALAYAKAAHNSAAPLRRRRSLKPSIQNEAAREFVKTGHNIECDVASHGNRVTWDFWLGHLDNMIHPDYFQENIYTHIKYKAIKNVVGCFKILLADLSAYCHEWPLPDLVAKMLQLEELFKKFEVQEEDCKTYVACEAAQDAERIAQNGPLVQQVSIIFRWAGWPNNFFEMTSKSLTNGPYRFVATFSGKAMTLISMRSWRNSRRPMTKALPTGRCSTPALPGGKPVKGPVPSSRMNFDETWWISMNFSREPLPPSSHTPAWKFQGHHLYLPLLLPGMEGLWGGVGARHRSNTRQIWKSSLNL